MSDRHSNWQNMRAQSALMLYPIFLGFAPVLGKLAYHGGSDPFTVAALRTVAAAGMMWIIYGLFWRRYIYIYPAGLLGCVVIGTLNGVGSLFYYSGLSLVSASVAQLLNSTYLIFVLLLSISAGHQLTRRTAIRVILALTAIVFITGGIAGEMNWLGAGLMIANALMFAGTFILGQRVLYEMPSQTVALYVLSTMAVVVVMARVVYRLEWIPQTTEATTAILVLGLTTALSRLTMFFSVKKMGSVRTVMIGISETAVSLILASILLGDKLMPLQWIGVAFLLVGLLLVDPHPTDKRDTGEMPVFRMAGIGTEPTSFNRIAFVKAFAPDHVDKFEEVTPEELDMIRRMMEAPPRY